MAAGSGRLHPKVRPQPILLVLHRMTLHCSILVLRRPWEGSGKGEVSDPDLWCAGTKSAVLISWLRDPRPCFVLSQGDFRGPRCGQACGADRGAKPRGRGGGYGSAAGPASVAGFGGVVSRPTAEGSVRRNGGRSHERNHEIIAFPPGFLETGVGGKLASTRLFPSVS